MVRSVTSSSLIALPVFRQMQRIVLLLLCLTTWRAVSAQTFSDPGFTAETVTTVTRFQTTGFTFAPDGRIFTTEKPGRVRVIKNGVMLSQPFLDIAARVNQNGDRGLIGLALDPNFATNGFVYVVYVFEPTSNTSDASPRTARLSRFQADPNNPDVALPNSEVILLGKLSNAPCSQYPAGSDCMGSDSVAHTIGSVRFGLDGKLYVGMGDGASFQMPDLLAFRSQDLNLYNGKILRINPDGTGLSDNPFYDGNPNSVRSKVYAYGLRSPFRFTIHPVTGELIIADVGSTKFEEVNRGRGANFGWPCFEGNEPNAGYQINFPQLCANVLASSVTKPLHTYARGAGASITGGPFYTATQYPEKYRGSYFFGDYVQNFLRRMILDSNGNVVSVENFATNVTTPVAIEQGPDGALYYLSIFTGEIKRIRYSGNLPVASATATLVSPATPYVVAFSSNGSSDPGGSALSIRWDFGDGTTATAVNPTHTYVTSGVKTFTATLTVTNAQGVSVSTAVNITVGSRPPVATITAPGNGVNVNPGETISFKGTTSDPDESLPATAMKWNVLLHHNDHIHPGQTTTGAGGSFVVEDHASPGEVFFYELVLTVTDSAGLTSTASIRINPIASTLPAPWTNADVGNPGLKGSAGFANGLFTLKGSGADIGAFSDAFHFVSQPISGDNEIIVRVNSVQNTAPGAKAGVMIRESLSNDAAHAFVSLSPTEGVSFEWRGATGFGTALRSGDYFAAPYWLRLVRSGDTLTGYRSSDGSNWIEISRTVISLPDTALFGLAVTANNNATLCEARLDNLVINKIVPNTPPTISLTAPAANASFTAPASVRLAATVSDGDGWISRVEFLVNNQVVHTASVSPYEFQLNNLSAGAYSITARATDNRGAVTLSSPVAMTVSNAANGTGEGLKGDYFRGKDFRDFRFSSLDAAIDFDWGNSVPDRSLKKDEFSVRWTGFVQPRFSGAYTFYATSSDGVRLWINNQLVVDSLASKRGSVTGTGTVTLTAGQKYNLRLEFYQKEKDGAAQIRLEWFSAQQPREVIPRNQLYTP